MYLFTYLITIIVTLGQYSVVVDVFTKTYYNYLSIEENLV